ncbi:hypothetical protein [Desulfocurvibacter africanus]|uniref:hypothetical protein n=1 Tax=Desulfocurvibacter africanus TaxID=873 RepID=UPI0004279EBE|nr:hypothetical protein [Desulfocurvibacter africanus]
MKSYIIHLWRNWRTALMALILAVFHFIHGLIPIGLTEHDRWGIGLGGIKKGLK